jgi:hypothetical protein
VRSLWRLPSQNSPAYGGCRSAARRINCAACGGARAREARDIEPEVRCLAALHVPEEGIVDFRGVARAMAKDVRLLGGSIRTADSVVSAIHYPRGRASAGHNSRRSPRQRFPLRRGWKFPSRAERPQSRGDGEPGNRSTYRGACSAGRRAAAELISVVWASIPPSWGSVQGRIGSGGRTFAIGRHARTPVTIGTGPRILAGGTIRFGESEPKPVDRIQWGSIGASIRSKCEEIGWGTAFYARHRRF